MLFYKRQSSPRERKILEKSEKIEKYSLKKRKGCVELFMSVCLCVCACVFVPAHVCFVCVFFSIIFAYYCVVVYVIYSMHLYKDAYAAWQIWGFLLDIRVAMGSESRDSFTE